LRTNLVVSQNKNEFGETIVSVSHSCNSDSIIWFMFMFASQACLLIGSSVLAYQMRSVPNCVNDSKELSRMIYSSFIFLVLRVVVYVFSGALQGGQESLQKARSLFTSLDVIVSVAVYFVRFFRESSKKDARKSQATFVSGVSIMNNTNNYGLSGAGNLRRQNTDLQQSVTSEITTENPDGSLHLQNTDCPQQSGTAVIPTEDPRGSFQRQNTDLLKPPRAKRRIRKGEGSETEYLVRADMFKEADNEDDMENLERSGRSEISVEEEKEEEDSPVITFRMKGKSIAFPKWVVDKHGDISKHESEPILERNEVSRASFQRHNTPRDNLFLSTEKVDKPGDIFKHRSEPILKRNGVSRASFQRHNTPRDNLFLSTETLSKR